MGLPREPLEISPRGSLLGLTGSARLLRSLLGPTTGRPACYNHWLAHSSKEQVNWMFNGIC